MENPFTLKLRVRYAECDAQQVVFNARYADYADLAATEFMRAMIGGYQELLSMGLDNQVVKLEINWKGSARFDDVLALRVTTAHIGTTSFVFKTSIVNESRGTEIAEVGVTYVMVDAKTFEKVALSDEMKSILQKGAIGVIVDQSGQ